VAEGESVDTAMYVWFIGIRRTW